MATSKTFIILLVCLFQYSRVNAGDIQEDCENVLANFFNEIGPIRQTYLNAEHNSDGTTFEDYVQNIKPSVTELLINTENLLENIEGEYADDTIDGAMVKALIEVSELFHGYEQAHADNEDYKGFVLSVLDDVKNHGVPVNEDYGYAVLKFFNERAAIWGELLNKFEGMDDDAKVEHFDEYMATAHVQIQEAQNKLEDIN